ncbi:MAG: family 4 glycosyl hydrolase [Planctomycetota bacterium]|jgi:alpha-galactosidase
MKVVLVGAGSRSFGPGSTRDVLLSKALQDLPLELALMDIVRDHLDDAADYANWVRDEVESSATVTATTDLREAVEGADFVIAAIERDRYLYWSMDFHVPRTHGLRQVYGENGGVGGIFHALRNMGPMVEIGRTMEELCPEATLLNFTNPESKLCEALTRLTSVQTVGLCHGVFQGREQLEGILDVPAEHLETVACGMNHFTWFQVIRDRRTGEDLYPRLRKVEREGDWLSDWHEAAMARVLFRRFGLWPSPAPNHYGEYVGWAEEFVTDELQYFYDPADGHPWETGQVPEFVYSLTSHPTGRPWRPAKAEPADPREAPLKPSGEVATQIIEGLGCGVEHDLAAVNVPNRGAIPNLPDDMVVEVPAVVGAEGLRTCPCEPLPEAIAAMLRLQGSIHKLIVEAFAERSRAKLVQAVLLDPTVDSYRRAMATVDELCRLQADVLPPLE